MRRQQRQDHVILWTNCKRLSVTIEWGCAAIRGLLSVGAKAAGSPVLSILETPPLCLPALRADGCCGDCWYSGYEPAVCEERYRQLWQCAHASSAIDMVVLLSTLHVSCVHEGDPGRGRGYVRESLLTCCSSFSVPCPTPLSSKSFLDASTTSWMIFS